MNRRAALVARRFGFVGAAFFPQCG